MTNPREKSANELEGPVTEVPIDVPPRMVLVRCPHCRHVVEAELLSQNLDVCPRCGHHMRLSARQRIKITVDDDSFVEWDAELAPHDPLAFPGYREKIDEAHAKSHEREAVVCGECAIGGERCAIFVMDSGFMMGSMGSAVGEKICRCFERAAERGLPVAGFTVSGGARMQEGVTSLMQMAKISAAVRRHGERGLLYVAVLTDPTTGGVTASFAMEADICLAEPDALVAFAGPRVVEQTTHKRLPAGFQRAEFLLAHGFLDMVVERKDVPSALAYLLFLHNRDAWGDPSHEVPRCSAAFPETPRWPVPKHLQKPLPQDGVTPYDLVRRVRDTNRASVPAVAEQAFYGLVELHGDHAFGDDPAIVGGIALLGGRPVTVICTDRGRTTKERVARNFGSPEPEGYRKALRLMRQAEKFGRPVICLVDTSGAFPGMEAEERGQGAAIADDIVAMSGLAVPEVSVIMGEGGSGGAIALATADCVLMLSDAVYSVVSPEGCATILWKTARRAPEAAEALGITAPTLERLGIVDGSIDAQGLGTPEFAFRLAERLQTELEPLVQMDAKELVESRYERFRRMGRFDA
ncbi:acetyl-CoA carboxylase, carboxyltransferase subunit beta [Olsenella sp. Marseille-P4559]|uniref:acetyl-CoA carboxylase, carboxyltransferase subunit beta n=1 Tax=Olsenella sp. Marseille-P4559 TaxID=2364795 RepID=UPI0010324BFA|nr:acetyl-CoA carboxylase, carboxyltransferase subunit beta [Olsenella sp. Marseille-P4559]